MDQKNENMIYKMLPEILIPWYRENARELPWRKDREPYHIWLSEIMLQQTRVEAVKGYYTRFLEELPDVKKLAEVEEERLLKLWEGLGYYNRARNLQKAAKWIVFENNGIFPSQYEEILKLPGIGEYTAGAIASNCFDEPVAAVDGNVLRIMSRIMESYEDILKASVKKQVKRKLERVYPEKHCGDFTQSLMELGAIICVPNGKPRCEICPVGQICRAHKSGTEMQLPVKEKKKLRKIEEKTVFILRCGYKIAIRKRKSKGLLAGMWELPNLEGKMTAEEALKTAQKWDCSPFNLTKQADRRHIFSHVEWDMTGFYIECKVEIPDLEWVSDEEMEKKIALPTAFKQFF